MMADYAREYPGYGWEHNRGYPTPDHRRALNDARADAACTAEASAWCAKSRRERPSPSWFSSEIEAGESFAPHHQPLSPATPL